MGACLGGNMTVMGSSANLVTSGISEHYGHKVGFVYWLKLGCPIVFITVGICTVYAVLLYGLLGWQNEFLN